MATYKFPQFDIEIVDPTITINGGVGTTVDNNVPSDFAYADIVLTTDTARFGVRLEGSPKPTAWEMADLEIWVGTQLKQYEV